MAVSVRRELPNVEKAYQDYLREMRETRRLAMTKASTGQAAVDDLFPALARWVRGYGRIEIGDQELLGFVVRALDYGG